MASPFVFRGFIESSTLSNWAMPFFLSLGPCKFNKARFYISQSYTIVIALSEGGYFFLPERLPAPFFGGALPRRFNRSNFNLALQINEIGNRVVNF